MKSTHKWSGHVFSAISVDGYIALPDGELDWLTNAAFETGHAAAFDSNNAPAGYEEFTAGVSHLVWGEVPTKKCSHLTLGPTAASAPSYSVPL